MTMKCLERETVIVFSLLFQRFLGDSTHSLLTGDEAEAAISRFQASLQNISDSIKARNESLELPYINLLPERIPDSIAI